ncbi:TetR/AcrR family transcriptional regulator [Streptomyces jumonjinensis]|uniref:TetR/AcrR family transcriptional regulator n=1 Tax=Streptomyces jumonjinensis TaxID=1945 RepID=A0A646KT65_STRJU|nr:TetR/AcrR family transcriptional regulator [Streptomyces jumonjinensis]MQT05494.1 TetR/AcrR family transcriptional regulator [Streptomyces jumonjinensis]
MQKRAEQTRQTLIRAAAELIGHGGLREAGLVNICESAGVSRGALYHHFATKEAVVVAVHEEARQETSAMIDAAFDAPDQKAAFDAPNREAAFREAAHGALSRFSSALSQALRDEPIVRAGLQLDPDGSSDSDRRLREEVLTAVRRRVSTLLPELPSKEGDLVDLAMVLMAGLESLGHADETWWSPATSDRIWRTLRPLFVSPTATAADSGEPGN